METEDYGLIATMQVSRQQRIELVELDGFDQVVVESGFARAPAIFFFAPAR
jgi:hypothetical protein